MKKTKLEKGITLVALIITIVVLLILAVVSIGAVRDSEIIGHATNTTSESTVAEEGEIVALAVNEWQLQKNTPNNMEDFKTAIETALKNETESGKVKEISENEDGSLTITFNKTNNKYKITSDGKVTKIEQTSNENVEWGYFETDGETWLLYCGDSENVVIASETLNVEKMEFEVTDTGINFNKTGELQTKNIKEFNRIEFRFIKNNIKTIDFGDKLSANTVIAFAGNETLTEVKGLEGLEILDSYDGGNGTFENCINLENVELPSTLKKIGDSAFDGCNNLKNINIPDDVTEIGYAAFKNCGSLTELKFPSNLSGLLDQDVINGCTGLTSIEIPIGVTNIHGDAMRSGTNLVEIKINRTKADSEATLGTDWIPSSVTKMIYSDCTVEY